MKRTVTFLALSILVVSAGIAISQGPTAVEQARSDLAFEEAKERIVLLRVVEEEVRLRVSILEYQIKWARLTAAFTPKPTVDPNAIVDPNSME